MTVASFNIGVGLSVLPLSGVHFLRIYSPNDANVSLNKPLLLLLLLLPIMLGLGDSRDTGRFPVGQWLSKNIISIS